MSSFKLAYSLAAMAVLSLAMLAACGGGGEGSPTATPVPSQGLTTTPPPVVSPTAFPKEAAQIAYVGADGAIWLVAADGSERTSLILDRCRGLSFLWSPQGDQIACVGTLGSGALSETLALVFDLKGHLLTRVQHPGQFTGFTWGAQFASPWSSSGRNLAYVVKEWVTPTPEGELPRGAFVLIITNAGGIVASIADGQQPRWSADGGRLAYFKPPNDTLTLYELASGREKTLGEGLRPLAWVLADKALLVAANYQEHELGGTWITYEVNLLDVATGEMQRVPELDNYTEFWLSPDRATAIVSSPRGPAIGVLDLASLQFTPIAGSVIGFPSDFIPQWQLAFSPDGSQIYWVDQSGWTPHAIYRANMDGTGLTKLGDVPGWFGAFSPDLTRVLYRGPDTGRDLWIANIDGSDARLLAENASDPVWLPQP